MSISLNDVTFDFLLNEYIHPVIIVDRPTGNILFFNDSAKKHFPGLIENAVFVEHFCGKNTTCKSCPLVNPENDSLEFSGYDRPCGELGYTFGSILYKDFDACMVIIPDYMVTVKESAFIKGINVIKAVEEYSGDKNLFFNILKVYYMDTAKRLDRIKEYYSASDYTLLRIEVHGIKGASYSIHADSLGDKAKYLEGILKKIEAGEEKYKEKLPMLFTYFLEELTDQLACMKPFVGFKCDQPAENSATEEAAEKEEITKEELKKLTETAFRYANDFDLESLAQVLTSLSEYNVGDEFRSETLSAQKYLSEYNYSELISSIEKMKTLVAG